MKIDLQSVIEDGEKLLAGLRELDGTDIDEDARGGHPAISAAMSPCASSC